jgi:hypothetical protein
VTSPSCFLTGLFVRIEFGLSEGLLCLLFRTRTS